MKSNRQLILIFLATVAVASMGSHAVIAWLGIQAKPVEHRLLRGQDNTTPLIFAAGSSLMTDALLCKDICRELGSGIETWFVPGSSPSEWEPLQEQLSKNDVTLLVVSAYDLNENILCDFRADVVPLSRTIRDLLQKKADWQFSRHVIAQYPLKFVRIFFPTTGRSQGVMTGIRGKFRTLLKSAGTLEAEAGPSVPSAEALAAENRKSETICDWPQDRVVRRIGAMRGACQGRQSFDGLKHMAFVRMLHKAQQQGRAIVVVLPVSPVYSGEFLTAETLQHFEDSLEKARRVVPKAQWIRLDTMPDLKSNEYFWDLVHMNSYGQRRATKALLAQLKDFPAFR